MMRKLLRILCLSGILSLLSLPAMAQWEDVDESLPLEEIIGLTCGNPLRMADYQSIDVPWGNTPVWITAWTYDLPVYVRYTMATSNIYDDDVPPHVLVDFSCTTGEYDDPKVDALINSADGWGYDIPVRLDFKFVERDYEANTTTYELGVSADYRNIMMRNGITYDVMAYVQLVIPRSGKVELVGDTEFRECMEQTTLATYPGTIDVSVNTMDDIYVLPVTEWRGDSVRFRWTGEERALLWIGATCDFELDPADYNVLELDTLQPAGTEGSYVDYSANRIVEMIDKWGDGTGVFYARLLSGQPGQLIIEPKPIEGPMADAIELQFDLPVEVEAGNTDQVYYFRRDDWRNMAIRLETTAAAPITAYFGTTVDFSLTAQDGTLIDSLRFVEEEGRMVLYLTEYQTRTIASASREDFIFVRFASADPTTLTPTLWTIADCVAQSVRILYAEDEEVVNTREAANLFVFPYEEWAAGDMQIRWSSIANLDLYVADTCSFNLTPNNIHVLYYERVDPLTSEDRVGKMTLSQDTLRSFANFVEDGYLYIRINPRGNGTLYISQTEPVNPPTAVPTATAESGLRVVYGQDGTIWVQTDTAQDLYLYNSVGMLMQRWQQAAGDRQLLHDLPQGVYILRGAQETVRIRR